MEAEIWRNLPTDGLEHYQVSNLGNVRNTSYKGTEKIRSMSQCTDKNGYFVVCLTKKDGKQRNYRVHRLVAEAFIPNPQKYEQVNHRDEVKTNNKVDNLEWCDCAYNNNYGTRNIRVSKSKINTNCKPVCQCDMDGNALKVWPSMNEINRQLGYDTGLIAKRCLGIGNSAYGFKWKYDGEEKPESWKRALVGKDTLYKPVAQIDSNGHVVRVWSSIKAAGEEGFSATMISACCNGRRNHTGGFSWKFYAHNGGNDDGSGNQTGGQSDGEGNSGD